MSILFARNFSYGTCQEHRGERWMDLDRERKIKMGKRIMHLIVLMRTKKIYIITNEFE